MNKYFTYNFTLRIKSFAIKKIFASGYQLLKDECTVTIMNLDSELNKKKKKLKWWEWTFGKEAKGKSVA